ncbi:Nucleobindin-2 [Trichinella pseudospiralis]|uniref:Nucleobindin-2 n=1 Tax=Trichinella pseudospiralis TaxID=6337 RepID=A0A0V1IWQ3_TRIPS|nr:Nucleobindin-2 [Trichinella pseudospiralis]
MLSQFGIQYVLHKYTDIADIIFICKYKLPYVVQGFRVFACFVESCHYNLAYEQYLKDVVAALESDPAFAERLRAATPEEIHSGKIAEALNFVDHNVRTKLNQIKLIELERLRKALEKKRDHENGFAAMLEHIDHNKDTFDSADLQLLIRKTSKDMDMLDQRQHQEYKEHEMKEELEYRRKLENMSPEERKLAEEKRNEEIQKRKNKKLKHPGSKGQLEEVWEEVDKLPKDAFDMNTFFHLHDTNDDGYLDILELEALFQKELDRVYGNDHAIEKEEELARLRKHVVEEMDKNHDGLISLSEFLGEEKSPDFQDNNDWSVLDPAEAFSEDELREYEIQWKKENGYDVIDEANKVQHAGMDIPPKPAVPQHGVPSQQTGSAPGNFQPQAPGIPLQQPVYQQGHGVPVYQVPASGVQGNVPPGQYQINQNMPTGQFQAYQNMPAGQFQANPAQYQQAGASATGGFQASLSQYSQPNIPPAQQNQFHSQMHGIPQPPNQQQQNVGNFQQGNTHTEQQPYLQQKLPDDVAAQAQGNPAFINNPASVNNQLPPYHPASGQQQQNQQFQHVPSPAGVGQQQNFHNPGH